MTDQSTVESPVVPEPQPAQPLVELRELTVHFPVRAGLLLGRTVGLLRAVDGVSLSIPRGTSYGLVGESGCGKSTLARGLLRLVEPTSGEILFDGTDLRQLNNEAMRRMRRRMQLVFQDQLSTMDSRQNVESLLTEGLRAHGLGNGAVAVSARLRDTLNAVGLPAGVLRRYPHELSGGQRQRVGLARALVLQPDLIVADEPVSALDVSIQAQVLNLLAELQRTLQLTQLVISHDLAVVRHIADVVGVMYLGVLVEEAYSDELAATPLHPYTRALLSAVPVPDPTVEDRRERILLSGDLPSSTDPPSGCRFHTRCPWVRPTRCADERPELRELRPGHRVACHWAQELAVSTTQVSGRGGGGWIC